MAYKGLLSSLKEITLATRLDKDFKLVQMDKRLVSLLDYNWMDIGYSSYKYLLAGQNQDDFIKKLKNKTKDIPWRGEVVLLNKEKKMYCFDTFLIPEENGYLLLQTDISETKFYEINYHKNVLVTASIKDIQQGFLSGESLENSLAKILQGLMVIAKCNYSVVSSDELDSPIDLYSDNKGITFYKGESKRKHSKIFTEKIVGNIDYEIIDSSEEKIPNGNKITSLIKFKLLHHNEVVGSICLANKDERFSAELYHDIKIYIDTASLILSAEGDRKKVEEARLVAENAAEIRSRILSNMSHEIRTPLTSVLGVVELLKETSPSEEQNKYIKLLETSGEFLLNLVNDVLDISKIEAGEIDLENNEFCTEDISAYIGGTFQNLIKEKGLHFSIKTKDLPIKLKGDKKRIMQIVFNLLGNAVKFTQDGSVDLIFSYKNKCLSIEVIDTGMGISDENKDMIFEHFYQVDNTSTKSIGGSGLGLHIVKSLSTLMGGNVSVRDNDKCKGTIFKSVIKVEEVVEKTKSKEKKVILTKPLNVLVVDDSSDNRMLVSAMFKKEPLVNLTLVESGFLAIEHFREHTYDLILMDIQMPEMNGYEATEAIRQYEEAESACSTLIYAFTANALKKDLNRSKESGCDGHVTKPFTKKSLYSVFCQVEKLKS